MAEPVAGQVGVEPRAVAVAVLTCGSPVVGAEVAQPVLEVEAGPVVEVERELAGEAGLAVVVVEQVGAEAAEQVSPDQVAAVELQEEAGLRAEEEGVLDREAARRASVPRLAHQENGYRPRQCCAVQELRALSLWEWEQALRAAPDIPSRKKKFVRCWDCSRNWVSREKIPNIAWTCRRSNRG